MALRFQARWLAPLALLAALLAVVVLFASSTGKDADNPPVVGTSTEQSRTQARARTSSTQPRTTGTTTSGRATSYTIKPGDTFGSIAEANDVTVAELQEANPGVDSAALTVGERIKLPR